MAFLKAVQEGRGLTAQQGIGIKAEPGLEALFPPFVFAGGRQQGLIHGHLADIGQPAVRGLLAAQLVHKAQLHGFAAGEDFARGQTRGAGAIHMTALGHDVHELLVHVLEHALEIGLFFRGERKS